MLHRICTYLTFALGVVHLLFTPFAYSKFTPNTLLFIGSGFAIVFAGFLNVGAMRSRNADDKTLPALCFIANALLAALFLFGITVMPEPQAWLGALLFVALTAASGRSLFDAKPL